MPLNSFQAGQIFQPVPPALLAQLTAIYLFRGKQELYERQAPEVLASLQRSAIIESSESSNRIEGVIASPARVREIVGLGAAPATRSEAEIAGYRDVLATIHASYPHMAMSPNTILQLHRDLYRLAGVAGGEWKNVDNTIEASLPDGTREVIFRPVAAFLTPSAMADLCRDFQNARDARANDEMILIAALVLDFLCIHPFRDGNGRIVRILTTLALYQAGFTIPRYVSIERIVEQTRDSYYASCEPRPRDGIPGGIRSSHGSSTSSASSSLHIGSSISDLAPPRFRRRAGGSDWPSNNCRSSSLWPRSSVPARA